MLIFLLSLEAYAVDAKRTLTRASIYMNIFKNENLFKALNSEFRLSNKIRKPCETEKNKYNSHVAEWLKSVDNTNLIRIRIQCESVYFVSCSVHYFFIECCQNFLAYGQRYPLEI